MSAPARAIKLRMGQSTQVDLEVPARTPIGVVLVDAHQYLRDYLSESGAIEDLPAAEPGWRLRTPIGTLLDNARSLDECGVHDGDALELITAPAGEEFQPRIESVSTAVAAASAKRFPRAEPADITNALTVLAFGFLAAAMVVLTVICFRAQHLAITAALLGVVAVVAVGAAVNARRWRRPLVADLCWALLIGFGPLAASLLIPFPWTAPHSVLTGAGIAALAIGAAQSGRHLSVYVCVAVVASFVWVAQVWSPDTLLPAAAVAAWLIVVAIIVLGRVELIAQRLARLPVSTFPSGSGRFVGRRVGGAGSDTLEPNTAPPDPAVLFNKAIRANQFLSALIAALAISCTGLVAVVCAHRADSWGWLLFAAGVPVLFAYRVWHYSSLRCIAWLLVGVYGPTAVLAGCVALTRGPWWGVAVLAGAAVLSALAPLSVPTETRTQAPLTRAMRVFSEYVLTAAVLLGPVFLLRIPQMVYNRDFGG